MNCDTFLGFATLIATVVTAYIAYQLQYKIAVSQRWDSLMTQYCTPEFGESVKAIIDFYIDDCDRILSKITSSYKNRYEEEFKDKTDEKFDVRKTLHFHRRNIEYFYWQLWCCVSAKGFNEKLIYESFNKNEMNIMVIAYSLLSN